MAVLGEMVRYVAPDDIDPLYASREFPAVVTEVDSFDPDEVGLFILWPTYAFMAWRPLADNPVTLDESGTPAGDTWHPVPV